MIPDFDDKGNLPPGFHRCTMDEILSRYGRGSPERRVETVELLQLVEWARQVGVKRLLVDGSYATDKQAPVDVDVVMLLDASSSAHVGSHEDLANRWPFIHAVVVVAEAELEDWANTIFCLDRGGNGRGILEVLL